MFLALTPTRYCPALLKVKSFVLSVVILYCFVTDKEGVTDQLTALVGVVAVTVTVCPTAAFVVDAVRLVEVMSLPDFLQAAIISRVRTDAKKSTFFMIKNLGE
jgi:hypothetical protein